jgi:hypothetical protein
VDDHASIISFNNLSDKNHLASKVRRILNEMNQDSINTEMELYEQRQPSH